MNNNKREVKVNFGHFVLKGSSYDSGQVLGEHLKTNINFLKFLTSRKIDKNQPGFEDFEEILSLHNKHCPGINEEIQGFADKVDCSVESIIYYDSMGFQGNCSHFSVLPSITADNHLYAAGSYEWNYKEEDLILISTKLGGKIGHIGFSMLLFGRYGGMNSQGLCITTSGGGAYSVPASNKKGINSTLAVRALLENCKNVKEVLKKLTKMPVINTQNYIISDKSGHIALVEGIDSKFDTKEITLESEQQFLCSTNHPTLPKMTKYYKYIHPWLKTNSPMRYKLIEDKIHQYSPEINQKNIKSLLSTEMPNGLCAYYHAGYFGTIWSMLFDLTQVKVDICFGPPSHNKWRSFSVDQPDTPKGYSAIILDKGTMKL
ncbi:MAG: C45 family autoproteolytic acyltransferase/hydrolase [Promethearchaeota archaeon]|jgi:predicted choloylglycine hydrolase